MLSERAARYVMHQHKFYHHSIPYLAAKWAKAHPDDTFEIDEAEALYAAFSRLVDQGYTLAPAQRRAIEAQQGFAPTVLQGDAPVPKKSAAKKKAPKKKANR